MITAKKLKEILANIPDHSTIYAYEGEETGLGIDLPDGSFLWVRASCCNEEYEQLFEFKIINGSKS